MEYILDCPSAKDGDTQCTIVPYTHPPATVDHYSFAPTWSIPVIALVLVVAIAGIVIVRWKAWDEKRGIREEELSAQVELAKARKVCPTCGDKYEPAVVS